MWSCAGRLWRQTISMQNFALHEADHRRRPGWRASPILGHNSGGQWQQLTEQRAQKQVGPRLQRRVSACMHACMHVKSMICSCRWKGAAFSLVSSQRLMKDAQNVTNKDLDGGERMASAVRLEVALQDSPNKELFVKALQKQACKDYKNVGDRLMNELFITGEKIFMWWGRVSLGVRNKPKIKQKIRLSRLEDWRSTHLQNSQKSMGAITRELRFLFMQVHSCRERSSSACFYIRFWTVHVHLLLFHVWRDGCLHDAQISWHV